MVSKKRCCLLQPFPMLRGSIQQLFIQRFERHEVGRKEMPQWEHGRQLWIPSGLQGLLRFEISIFMVLNLHLFKNDAKNNSDDCFRPLSQLKNKLSSFALAVERMPVRKRRSLRIPYAFPPLLCLKPASRNILLSPTWFRRQLLMSSTFNRFF